MELVQPHKFPIECVSPKNDFTRCARPSPAENKDDPVGITLSLVRQALVWQILVRHGASPTTQISYRVCQSQKWFYKMCQA